MPQVDTSIYQNQQNQPLDPLATLNKFATTQNALNQNKLFGQEFAARQALGPIIQQATDPTTGQTDYNKVNALMANNPATAFKAPEFAAQAIQRQKDQLEIQKSQIELNMKHNQTMMSQFSALAAKPDLSMKDLTASAGDMVAQGLVTPQEAAIELSRASGIPQDPASLRAHITNSYLLPQMQAEQRMQAIYGQLQTVNTGGQTVTSAVSPLTGARPVQVLNNSMSPGEAASPTPVMQRDANGNLVPTNVTRAQFATMSNGGGGVQSGPALGQEAAANVSGTENAKQGITLQQLADQAPQRKAALGNLETDLQNFTSGPGADWTKVGKAAVNRFNPFGNVFDPQSIASQEGFVKQATQLALQQRAALGGSGTDEGLEAAFHANPNEALSKLGNQQIIQLLKGNEDAISVKNQEWQKAQLPVSQGGLGYGPQDYGKFSTQFNKSFDPRVFQSVYMTPAQRADILKGMTSDSEKAKFRQSYNMAVANGWIPDVRTASNASQ